MTKILLLITLILFVSFYPNFVGGDRNNGPELFGGGVITQIGLVVKDIDKASKAYADFLGVDRPESFLTDTVEKAHTKFKGRSTEACAKLAFFQLENITIELIEPVGGPSTWQDFLETKGEGIHHIAFEIKGMEGKIKILAGKNMPLLQSGDYEGGRYSYIDSTEQLGTILELLENFSE